VSERELARRLTIGINNMRLAVLDKRLQGERRKAAEEELLALRLARAGVFTKNQRAYLARHGVYRRRPKLVR
jgi:hypothetical protein